MVYAPVGNRTTFRILIPLPESKDARCELIMYIREPPGVGALLEQSGFMLYIMVYKKAILYNMVYIVFLSCWGMEM